MKKLLRGRLYGLSEKNVSVPPTHHRFMAMRDADSDENHQYQLIDTDVP